MSETRRINIEADDPRSHIVNVCSPTTPSEASGTLTTTARPASDNPRTTKDALPVVRNTVNAGSFGPCAPDNDQRGVRSIDDSRSAHNYARSR